MADFLQERLKAFIETQKAIIERLEANINPSPDRLGDMFTKNLIQGKQSVLDGLEAVLEDRSLPP